MVSMVQGHTTTALLAPDALPTHVEQLHALLHGLTAPTFLFGAGLAFGVTSYERYAAYRQPGRALNKRLLRYLTLFLLGYALQLPGSSLWAAFHVDGEKLSLVCRVGPLQLIALVLGMCQLAMLVLQSARAHALFAGSGALLVTLCATPVARAGFASRLGPFFGAYVDDSLGSQFPIFPWAGFALAGVASAYALRAQRRFARWPLLAVGSALAGVTYAAFYWRWLPYERAFFWRTGALYLLFRLGCVVALLGLLTRVADATRGTSTGWSAQLAQHSLIAYVAHLLILYGTPFTPNLAHRWGTSLGLWPTALASVLMLIATVAAVYAWEALSRGPVWFARGRQLAWAVVGLLLLRP